MGVHVSDGHKEGLNTVALSINNQLGIDDTVSTSES